MTTNEMLLLACAPDEGGAMEAAGRQLQRQLEEIDVSEAAGKLQRQLEGIDVPDRQTAPPAGGN
jgi:hypothetical protein